MKFCSVYQYQEMHDLDKNYPSTLIIPNKKTIEIPADATAYAFVAEGEASVEIGNKTFQLYQGMYISVAGTAIIKDLTGFICLRKNNDTIFTLGGPIEKFGRLKYINGCSDTLLLSPLKLGDPCFNYLYVPPNILQTPHTHPSVRVGCIFEGKGFCQTEEGVFDLEPGNIFILIPEELHNFYTKENFLRIVVYHPDSDFGPSHEIHPMVNKTYVEGISVRGENQYRTVNITQ